MKRHKFTIETGTPDELEVVTKSREFRACSDQQKAFVLDLLTTGNPRHALEVAYPRAAVASRRSLQAQVLRAEAVVNVLELWKWRDTENARASLIAIVREQLRAAGNRECGRARLATQLERLILGINMGRRPIVDEAAGEPQPTEQAVKDDIPASRVPASARPLVDAQGVVRGYRTAAGEYVQLAEVEVSK